MPYRDTRGGAEFTVADQEAEGGVMNTGDPVLLNQYKVFRADGKPVGVALWAYVNDEVEERIKSGDAKKLTPQDWKSGDKPMLIELVAPFGGRDEILEMVKEKIE